MSLLSYACYEGYGREERRWCKVVNVLWRQRVVALHNSPRVLVVVVVITSGFPRDTTSCKVLIVIPVLGISGFPRDEHYTRDSAKPACAPNCNAWTTKPPKSYRSS